MEHNIVASLRSRDRRVLGRAVSIAENGGERASNLVQRLKSVPSHSSLIGFTGTPGSGKSTLLDALVSEFRRRGFTVAIIAIDPSSPFSGGAVLGDRCRMGRHQTDAGVYIRSLSARGGTGALSAGAGRVLDVLKAGPFDLILLETVGAGQSEVDVADLVDVCVVVCTPNSGDDVQAIKSGILEIADILVVNKMDLAGSDRSVQQLKLAQSLPSNAQRNVPVLSTAALQPRGIDDLADHILQSCRTGAENGRDRRRLRRRLVRAISTKMEEKLLHVESAELDQLCDSMREGEYDAEQAALAWLKHREL